MLMLQMPAIWSQRIFISCPESCSRSKAKMGSAFVPLTSDLCSLSHTSFLQAKRRLCPDPFLWALASVGLLRAGRAASCWASSTEQAAAPHSDSLVFFQVEIFFIYIGVSIMHGWGQSNNKKKTLGPSTYLNKDNVSNVSVLFTLLSHVLPSNPTLPPHPFK